ncbi:class I SAM-dependent methyltransferase [Domibacillus indicus]|uniref:class I SAM-dependent methyltransferase n=1 Tax=Domibacillus indicus TaxID=1437523 RepID=UPI000617E56A|nr:class I SAM-dependent methyltransferase [Domibacillus indicus]
MKQNKASVTSLLSAFGRAHHSRYDTPVVFDDFLAEELMSPKEFSDIRENLIQGAAFFNKEAAQRLHDQPEELVKWITQIQLSPTPLARAAYSEDVLLHEITLGAAQYVILGAGLDTFCWRHPDLAGRLEIFEIDYPATQEFKKEKLAHAGLEIPDCLHFVPMDFTRTFSYEPLQAEGFADTKTFFSLLGVLYYLTKEETASLIRHLFVNVPSGSSIVFDYADERLFDEKGLFSRVENMVKLAEAGGEPMKSCFSYAELETMLEEAGLLIYEHLPPAAIQDRFFSSRTDHLMAFETIHYVHAVKK